MRPTFPAVFVGREGRGDLPSRPRPDRSAANRRRGSSAGASPKAPAVGAARGVTRRAADSGTRTGTDNEAGRGEETPPGLPPPRHPRMRGIGARVGLVGALCCRSVASSRVAVSTYPRRPRGERRFRVVARPRFGWAGTARLRGERAAPPEVRFAAAQAIGRPLRTPVRFGVPDQQREHVIQSERT